MRPWRWVYWRIAHILGWHRVEAGQWECLFCPVHRPVKSVEEYRALFNKEVSS